MKFPVSPVCLIAMILSAHSLTAEEPVNEPLISHPIKLIASDNFDRAQLGDAWETRGNAVTAAIVDGTMAVTRREISDRDRRPSFMLVKYPKVMNLGLTFRFKVPKGSTASFSLGGVGVGNVGKGTGWVVSLKIEEKRTLLRGDVATIAKVNREWEPDKWYTGMLEVVGDTVVFQVDGEKIVEGKKPSIARNTKAMLGVNAKGTIYVDDLAAVEIAPK